MAMIFPEQPLGPLAVPAVMMPSLPRRSHRRLGRAFEKTLQKRW
jgi:hypothetical protein